MPARAKQLGYKQLHLDTSEQLVAARHLYEKNGYREVTRGKVGAFTIIQYEESGQGGE